MQAALGRPAGCDVLDMLWRDKLGLSQVPHGPIRYGKTWIHLKNGILRYRGHREHRLAWRRYVGHLATRPTFALLSLSDPRPFLTDMRPLLHRHLRASPF